MKSYLVRDEMTMTSRQITDEGFLVAPGTLARVGVQAYRARELGMDGDGDRLVRLHRPREEVFAADSLASFEAKPVTLGHPAGNRVTAENWRDLAVGDVRDVAEAGEEMRARLIVRDRAAVKAIEGGKTALSNGYTFDLDPTPGVSVTGDSYDGVMRNIRGNHVAIVDFARGGSACRIADGQGAIQMKKIVVDGITLELEETAAGVVERAQMKAKEAADAAEKLLSEEAEKTKQLVADHAAQVEAIKKEAQDPAQIEALVVARARAIADAAKLAPAVAIDGKTTAQVRRETLSTVMASQPLAQDVASAVLAGKAVNDAADDVISTALEACKAALTNHITGDALAAGLIAQGATSALNKKPTEPRGREAFIANTLNAWRGESR